MEEKIVKTINGQNYPESFCRRIKGEYYLIGNNKIENSGDIYLINNRYIRFTKNRLVFDHSKKEYVIKNNELIEGVVNFNNENPILGYFTLNSLYNVEIYLKNHEKLICINEKIIPLYYRECRSTGIFYHISLKTVNELNTLREVEKRYKESLPYDSKGITQQFVLNYEQNYKPVICKNVETYGKYLKDYTFGLEFETTKGILTNKKLNQLPLIPLRDGSISGLEYVTIPLEGKKGLQALIDSVYELKKRTEYDISCSTHLHIGNIPRTPEFILAFWKFMSVYQNQIFQMFPLYKKYNFGIKRKEYSKPLPIEKVNFYLDPVIDKKNINKNFNVLFRYLSEGDDMVNYDYNLDNVKSHHRDPNGNQKWNINTRYYFTNLIPLIFGNKQTIEFRIHTPTYNINKIINFLYLNVFIIDYVKNNTESILLNKDGYIKNGHFLTWLSDQIQRNVNINTNTFHKEVYNYFNKRLDLTENFNQKGFINYDEENIKTYNNIKWESSNINLVENINVKKVYKEIKPGFFKEQLDKKIRYSIPYDDYINQDPLIEIEIPDHLSVSSDYVPANDKFLNENESNIF